MAFSQLHGTAHADIDGDGIQDFIVGKRYWSHQDTQIDPDPYGPPVLYWYRTVRNPEGAWRRGVRARADPQPVWRRL